MSSRGAAGVSIGEDVLGTERDESTGALLAQIGDVIVEQASSQGAEIWQQPGFCSRPASAVPGESAAQCVVFRQGDRDAIIAMRDMRSKAMYGTLEAGETAVFGSAGQARLLFKEDGTASLITTEGNTESGATIMMTVSPTQGFMFSSPWGGFSLGPAGFLAFTQDGSTFKGSFEVRSSGNCVASGPAFQAMCSQVSLGIVPPTGVTNTCLYGVTGVAGVASTSVFIAP